MKTIILTGILIIGGYLLGAIPFSYLAGYLFKRIDLRKVGSKNVGGANVFLQAGPIPGIIAIILDLIKGLPFVIFAKNLKLPSISLFLIAASAVAGHNWSIYLRFAGGQGLGTSSGLLFYFLPKEFLISATIGIIIGFTSPLLKMKGWFSSKIHCGALVAIPLILILSLFFPNPFYMKLCPFFIVFPIGIKQLQLIIKRI
jgi:acyl-phosphate glycerol 3-phosphate acyltransferase